MDNDLLSTIKRNVCLYILSITLGVAGIFETRYLRGVDIADGKTPDFPLLAVIGVVFITMGVIGIILTIVEYIKVKND